MKQSIVLTLLILTTLLGPHSNAADGPRSFTADISMHDLFPGAPSLKGKLYLRDGHLRIDWGGFADVFDLKQREGWRIFPEERKYTDLGSKDLSTYAPEMMDGSICPHAQVPSDCKLLEKANIYGRLTRKWDLWNQTRGFHVYFWTDDALQITVRCEIGEGAYEVRNLRHGAVAERMFELPAGYERFERPWRP